MSVIATKDQSVLLSGAQNTEKHISMPGFNSRYFPVQAQSYGQSGWSFRHEFPPKQIIKRNVGVSYKIEVVLTGKNNADTGAAKVWTKGGYALAQFPLHRVMKSLEVTMNNNSKTVKPHVWHNALMRYANHSTSKHFNSMTPNHRDTVNNNLKQMIKYDGKAIAKADMYYATAHSLEGCKGQMYYTRDAPNGSRGAIRPTSIAYTGIANDGFADAVTLEYEIFEELHHPFFSSSIVEDSLANISNISVDMNFLSDLSPMMTTTAVPIIANDVDGAECNGRGHFDCAVTFKEIPKLLFKTTVPSVSIPSTIKMPYVDMKVSRTNFSCKPGKSATVKQSDQTGTQVPDQIIIFARRAADLSSCRQADSFCSIDKISLRTQEHNQLFAGMSTEQIYHMCVKNGLVDSYDEFREGSVVLFDLHAGDIPGLVPGTLAQFPYSFEFTFTNRTGTNGYFDRTFTPYSESNLDKDADAKYADYGVPEDWTAYVILVNEGELFADTQELNMTTGHSEQVSLDGVVAGVDPAGVQDPRLTVDTGAGFFSHKGWNRFGKQIGSVAKGALSMAAKSGVGGSYSAALSALDSAVNRGGGMRITG